MVIALYNGIGVEDNRPEHVDSLSVIHLGEHLERLTAADLRKLDTHVPLETLRAVVELATEIGQEGREGKPVGTMFVVGDTDKVLTMWRPLNFNPFRGYSRKERDIRDKKVREQIKDLAQLEGAIIVRRDGVAEAACMYIDAPTEASSHQQGLGHAPLGRRRHQQEDEGDRHRRQPIVGPSASSSRTAWSCCKSSRSPGR